MSWRTMLEEKLEAAGADAAMVEYATSILEDPDDDIDAKVEALTGFLADLEVEDPEPPAKALVVAWADETAEEQSKTDAAEAKQKEESLQRAEEERQRILKAGAADNRGTQSVGVKDAALRKALVAQYDEASSGEDDEGLDGTPVVVGVTRKNRRARKQATAQELALGHVNTNKLAPQMAQQAAREAAREEAARKKVNDKATTQGDRDRKAQAKEARRAKAAKGERRR
eukprot:m.252317 g.252317  ORF g.252317 m.252317 type:complete len:228 (-) comp15912_c1_seq1:2462-3145(-)